MSLDKAIYFGVCVSVILFLRRVRVLRAEELGVGPEGRLLETHLLGDFYGKFDTCKNIKIVHLEGSLFFGAAGELEEVLHDYVLDEQVSILILRLKRTQGLDLTTTQVLVDTSRKLSEEGRALFLTGVRLDTLTELEKTGAVEVLGRENIFPFRPQFFAAMEAALTRAFAQLENHECDACRLKEFLDTRDKRI